jgi:hypothetical protein
LEKVPSRKGVINHAFTGWHLFQFWSEEFVIIGPLSSEDRYKYVSDTEIEPLRPSFFPGTLKRKYEYFCVVRTIMRYFLC